MVSTSEAGTRAHFGTLMMEARPAARCTTVVVESTTEVVVRNLWPEEPAPAILEPELRGLQLDPEWFWVVEVNKEPVAYLLGAEVLGVATLLRLRVIGNNGNVLPVLLVRVLESLKSRGYTSFGTFLSVVRPEERKLLELIKRVGGEVLDAGVVAVCPVEVR